MNSESSIDFCKKLGVSGIITDISNGINEWYYTNKNNDMIFIKTILVKPCNNVEAVWQCNAVLVFMFENWDTIQK